MQRQHIRRRLRDGLVEAGQKRGAGVGRVVRQIVCGSNRFAFGLPHRTGQSAQRVLVGRPHLGRGQPETVCNRTQHLLPGVRRH